MIKTPNLNLPVYDNASKDTFRVADWNEANTNIDYVFGELKKNPNVNAIDITARQDIINNHRNVTEQLDNITQGVGRVIKDRLANNLSINTILIGDSLTSGNGSTGWKEPTSATDGTQVIFTDTDNKVYYEAVYTCPSWANKLRGLFSVLSPTSKFLNAGIGGKSAKWFNARKLLLQLSQYDIAIIQLGTNDRWDTSTELEFKTQYIELVKYVKTIIPEVILMSATPVLQASDDGKALKQYQIDKVIKQVCKENNWKLISHFDDFKNDIYLKNDSGINYFKDATHLNDKGYNWQYNNTQKRLGLYDSVENCIADNGIVVYDYNKITLDMTPASFPQGQIGHYPITISWGNTNGFPENWGGNVIVDKSIGNGYERQFFYLYGRTGAYQRVNVGGNWGEWTSLTGGGAGGATSVTALDYVNNSTLATDAKFSNNTITITPISNGNASGLPRNLGGTLETRKISTNNSVHQLYYSINRNEIYTREWNGSAWGTWVKLINQSDFDSQNFIVTIGDNGVTNATLWNDPLYKTGKYIYCTILNTGASGFPDNVGGTLETNNIRGLAGFTKQTYYKYNTNDVYTRSSKSDNSWTAWAKITSV